MAPLNVSHGRSAEADAIISALKAQEGFAELPVSMLDRICRECALKAFDRDEILLTQGDDSDHALLIVTGGVKADIESAYGTVVVGALSAPCLIGEIGALASLPRTATIRASTPGVAIPISRQLLLEIAAAAPELHKYVVSQLGAKLRQFNTTISLYSHALSALEQNSFDENFLEDLRNPVPELAEFGQNFARMAEQIIMRRQRADEMASAAIIQRALLPKEGDFAKITTADVYGFMAPAREVGGDFYDLIRLKDGRIAIGIGDVCGKGVPAALFMGITKTMLRHNIKFESDLGIAFTSANDFLVTENAAELFATTLYAIFDPGSGAVEYCSCGHNPGCIRRADGAMEILPGGGIPVGIFDGVKMKVQRAQLSAGDMLFLYTDGLTEAPDQAGEEFGETRLFNVLKNNACSTVKGWAALMTDALRAFTGNEPQFDDITFIGLMAR